MRNWTTIVKWHPGIYLHDIACGLKYPSSRRMLTKARDLKVSFYTITLEMSEGALHTSLRLQTEHLRRKRDAL